MFYCGCWKGNLSCTFKGILSRVTVFQGGFKAGWFAEGPTPALDVLGKIPSQSESDFDSQKNENCDSIGGEVMAHQGDDG